MPYTNITPEEQWRLTGTFTPETAEHLLDVYQQREEIKDNFKRLQDAYVALPEDFLDCISQEVDMLNVRGENKERLKTIVGMIEQLQQEINRAAEHTNSVIRSVLNG